MGSRADRSRRGWVLGVLSRAWAVVGLALAVLHELLRGAGGDDHGMVVESDGDDAWAG